MEKEASSSSSKVSPSNHTSKVSSETTPSSSPIVQRGGGRLRARAKVSYTQQKYTPVKTSPLRKNNNNKKKKKKKKVVSGKKKATSLKKKKLTTPTEPTSTSTTNTKTNDKVVGDKPLHKQHNNDLHEPPMEKIGFGRNPSSNITIRNVAIYRGKGISSFGIAFTQPTNKPNGLISIKSLVPGGVSDSEGTLQKGDILLKVNGLDVSGGCHLLTLSQKIRSCGDPLVIDFYRSGSTDDGIHNEEYTYSEEMSQQRPNHSLDKKEKEKHYNGSTPKKLLASTPANPVPSPKILTLLPTKPALTTKPLNHDTSTTPKKPAPKKTIPPASMTTIPVPMSTIPSTTTIEPSTHNTSISTKPAPTTKDTPRPIIPATMILETSNHHTSTPKKPEPATTKPASMPTKPAAPMTELSTTTPEPSSPEPKRPISSARTSLTPTFANKQLGIKKKAVERDLNGNQTPENNDSGKGDEDSAMSEDESEKGNDSDSSFEMDGNDSDSSFGLDGTNAKIDDMPMYKNINDLKETRRTRHDSSLDKENNNNASRERTILTVVANMFRQHAQLFYHQANTLDRMAQYPNDPSKWNVHSMQNDPSDPNSAPFIPMETLNDQVRRERVVDLAKKSVDGLKQVQLYMDTLVGKRMGPGYARSRRKFAWEIFQKDLMENLPYETNFMGDAKSKESKKWKEVKDGKEEEMINSYVFKRSQEEWRKLTPARIDEYARRAKGPEGVEHLM